MNREQLIRKLRRYAKARDLVFDLDIRRGNGSHYRIRVGTRISTIQSDLNPGRIERILQQLDVDPADL